MYKIANFLLYNKLSELTNHNFKEYFRSLTSYDHNLELIFFLIKLRQTAFK